MYKLDSSMFVDFPDSGIIFIYGTARCGLSTLSQQLALFLAKTRHVTHIDCDRHTRDYAKRLLPMLHGKHVDRQSDGSEARKSFHDYFSDQSGSLKHVHSKSIAVPGNDVLIVDELSTVTNAYMVSCTENPGVRTSLSGNREELINTLRSKCNLLVCMIRIRPPLFLMMPVSPIPTLHVVSSDTKLIVEMIRQEHFTKLRCIKGRLPNTPSTILFDANSSSFVNHEKHS